MISNLQLEQREHNCKLCHEGQEHDHEHGTKSLVVEQHKHNGHKCEDPGCDIEHNHAHIHAPEVKHEHSHDCGHDHSHDYSHDHSHDKSESAKNLEELIANSAMSHSLKTLATNFSFLSPALIAGESLQGQGLLSPLLSITAMHGLNRGVQKLERFGLTLGISALTWLAQKTGFSRNLSRVFASAALAIVEKFYSNDTKNKGFQTLLNNLGKKEKWQELIPSLLSIEAKALLIGPGLMHLTDRLGFRSSHGVNKRLIGPIVKALTASFGFLGLDLILKKIADKTGNESFASAASTSLCACCGSPVCTTAAVDTVLVAAA